jgi:hypothetical protein
MAPRPKQQLDHVRETDGVTHDSRQTEEAPVTWINRILARNHGPLP